LGWFVGLVELFRRVGLVLRRVWPLVNAALMSLKPTADFSHFDALDIRTGRIVRVEDAQTRKPTYKLTIDFGPEIGSKVSCGAYRNYAKDALLGKTVICVINFGAKKMGPEISEVLVLGVADAASGTIYLTTEQSVPPGATIF
jgi:tRNA-binding protein